MSRRNPTVSDLTARRIPQELKDDCPVYAITGEVCEACSQMARSDLRKPFPELLREFEKLADLKNRLHGTISRM